MKLTKTTLTLILIILLAFGLRLFSASQVDIGSDEMIYSIIPWNIISAHRLSTVEQAPLYFYLTDLSYKLTGGLSLISSRIPSIVFGSFAIILVYLCARELGASKPPAILSAFLFALSGYAIRYNQEMDMIAFFFSLLSMFFFMQFLKEENDKKLYVSALFLALGVLAKPIILIFVPAYLLVWIAFKHPLTEKKNPLPWKKIFFAFLICILVVSPVLIYNFLLFKEKGMTDYYFTVLAGIGNASIYGGQEAEGWSFTMLWNVIKSRGVNLLGIDAIIMTMGLLGIFIAWKHSKRNTLFLTLSFLFLILYLAGKMSSPTHYVWIPLILSIFAGTGAYALKEKITQKWKFHHTIAILILLASINTIFFLPRIAQLDEQSIAITLKENTKSIPDNAVIVLDPRIYRGIFAWAFHDKHYLEGTYFPEFSQKIQQIPGKPKSVPLYYVECGPGTYCGWKPEDFNRIAPFGEQLSSVFQENLQKTMEIKAIDTFIVYQGAISIPDSAYEIIDQTHQHWYTPVGWKYPELAVDNYTPKTVFDRILNGVGFILLYADVVIALSSLILVFYLLGKPSD